MAKTRRGRNKLIPQSAKKPRDAARSNEKLSVNNDAAPDGAPVMFRYPLDRLDNSVDALYISIFDQIRSSKIFGLGNKVRNDNGKLDIVKIGSIKSYNDFVATNTNAQKKKNTNAEYIYLPIPQQVSDALAVSYGDDTLNPIQSLGLSATASAIDNPGKAVLDTAQIMKDMFSGNLAGIDEETKKAIGAVFTGTAVNQFGANVNPNSLISRASGQILQSNLELLFSGVTLRSFPFIFDFVPREKREADQVRSIIRTLKKAMSPKSRSSLFIQAPKVFQLEYVSGQESHPFLNKFKLCSLTDMTVNYTASGTYATYEDGTPVHIQVQCVFKEINPIYAEDYEEQSFNGPYANVEEALNVIGGVGF